MPMTTHHHAPSQDPAWVHGHAHEPNPAPPSPETAFVIHLPNDRIVTWDVADLQQLPTTVVPDCYIVSTGHGTSGPFIFAGVRLQDFLEYWLGHNEPWAMVDLISSDGFGTRLTPADLAKETGQRPSLLACTLNDEPLTREKGLIRLIVPTETDDALRQVKWVSQIIIYADHTSVTQSTP